MDSPNAEMQTNLKSYVDIHIGVFIQHHKYLFKNHKYLFT